MIEHVYTARCSLFNFLIQIFKKIVLETVVTLLSLAVDEPVYSLVERQEEAAQACSSVASELV